MTSADFYFLFFNDCIYSYFFIFGCSGSSLLHVCFSCGQWGYCLPGVRGLLTALAPLAVAPGL